MPTTGNEWHYILLVQSPSVKCPEQQLHSGFYFRNKTNSKNNGDTSILFSMTARLQVLTPLYLTNFTLPCVAVHVSYFYSMTAWSILREKREVSGGVSGSLDFFFLVCLWFVLLSFLIKKWLEYTSSICDCHRKCSTFFYNHNFAVYTFVLPYKDLRLYRGGFSFQN